MYVTGIKVQSSKKHSQAMTMPEQAFQGRCVRACLQNQNKKNDVRLIHTARQ